MYKYKITEFLENLSAKQSKLLTKQVHKEIGISKNTLGNYSRISYGDKSDIPYCIVRKIEILFGMKSGELINQEITGTHYLEVISKTAVTLKKQRKQKAA